MRRPLFIIMHYQYRNHDDPVCVLAVGTEDEQNPPLLLVAAHSSRRVVLLHDQLQLKRILSSAKYYDYDIDRPFRVCHDPQLVWTDVGGDMAKVC